MVLIAAVSILVLGGLTGAASLATSGGRPADGRGTGAATVVTGAVSGRWQSVAEAPVGSTLHDMLRVHAVEPLHHLVIGLSAGGTVTIGAQRRRTEDALPASGLDLEVPVTLRRAGSGSLEARITAVNASGQGVGATAVLYVAADATESVISTRSNLDAQISLLALQRPVLGPVAYAAQLDALRGGGAQVHVMQGPRVAALVAAHVDATSTTVSGTIRYTASDGSVHPARNVAVEVWDHDSAQGDTPLTTVYADDAGAYSATVSTARPGGVPRQLYVQALAEADTVVNGAPNGIAAFVVHDPGSTAAQYIDSRDGAASVTAPVTATGAPITIDMTANNTAVNNTAFAVADALETGMQYTVHLDACGCLSVPLTYTLPLSVAFPYDGTRSQYSSTSATLQVVASDQFNWVILLHEYGHVVAGQMGITESPGGPHNLYTNDAANFVPPDKLAGMRLAWGEGFATFFSLMAEDYEKAYTLGIPNVLDGVVDVYGYHVNYANSQGTRVVPETGLVQAIGSLGEDTELSVGRALYQFYKSPAISLPDTTIIKTLEAVRPAILSDAVGPLVAAGGGAPFDDSNDISPAAVGFANEYACVLSAQAVAPVLLQPANESLVEPGQAPQFSWDPGGAGGLFPLDEFTVQFWSANWDKLLFESKPQSATTYTPLPADWSTIVNSTDAGGNPVASLNVTVKGTAPASLPSSDATTGPYKSCADTLHLDRPAADLTEPSPPGGSLFGQSVGLSRDGLISVVGAPGSCLGIISTAQGCEASTVSFYSLDPASNVWRQVGEFGPADLGIPGCTVAACPGANDLGESVAMSGDGSTAAVSFTHDTGTSLVDLGNTWSLDVVTLARENGSWVVTGTPTSSQRSSVDVNLGEERAPFESVALDATGDSLLVADQFHPNTALDAGSTSSNLLASRGEVYSFTSAGHGDPGGFTATGIISDTTPDPHAPLACPSGPCSTWNETFGAAVALSGDGKTATVSDQAQYNDLGDPSVATAQVTDLYRATVDGSGVRHWGTTAAPLSGGDVASGFTQVGSSITCNGQACLPEDFGAALALSDDGSTVFVGDPNHAAGAGAVYVFHAPAGSPPLVYQQVGELADPDGGSAGLGAALASAADGAAVLAGEPNASSATSAAQGQAATFAAGPTGWATASRTAVLTADDPASYDRFGTAVAMSGDGTLNVIGSPGDLQHTAYTGGYDGAVYTLLGATPTTLALGAPALAATPAGGAQGTVGAPITLMATVSPPPDGGTVAFTGPSGPVVGCAAVAVAMLSGTAQCPLTLPAASTLDATLVDSPLSYSATFSGSSNYAPSAPGTLGVSVVTPLLLAAPSLPTLTAGVPLPSGSVALGASGGSGPLSWALVTDATNGLPPSMVLGPDGTFAGQIPAAGAYTFTVEVTDHSPVPQSALETLTWLVAAAPVSGPPPTTVTLYPLGSTIYGSPATATVLVSAAPSDPPAGDLVTVAAIHGTLVAGTCKATLPGGPNDTASCSLPAALSAGTYSVAATFEGAGAAVAGADANFASATSAPESLLVDPAPTTTTITQPRPVDQGTSAEVSVTVAPSGTGTTPPLPSDTVTVSAALIGGDGTPSTCSAPLSSGGTTGSCDLGNALAVGTYALTATFASDANFVASTTSATLNVVYGTTTTVTDPLAGSSVAAGASLTFSAVVEAPGAPGTPTGTVTFASGAAELCSTPALVAGVATCSASTAPVGSDLVTASFQSPALYAPSSGTTTVMVSVTPPAPPLGATQWATGTGTSSFVPAVAAVPGLTATGSGPGALTVAIYGSNPTGTAVTGGTGVFYDVDIARGSDFNPLTILACGLGKGGNGLEWWNGAVWQPFSNQVVDTGANAGCVTATVAPASSFSGTTPTTEELTGTPIAAVDLATGDFTVNINPKSQNLGENGSVGYTVTVGSSGGFAAPVALTVSGLPAGVTGSFAPATVNPDGASASSILTLTSGPTLTSSGGGFSVTGSYGTGSGAVVHSANDGSVTLNFELQPTCYGTIDGTVTDVQTDKPISGAVVTASGGQGVDQTTTAADGTYTLSKVLLGANNGTTTSGVRVTAPGYFTTSGATVVVSCGPTAIDDVALSEIETSSLEGHVDVGVPNPASPDLAPIATSTPVNGAVLSLAEYQANSGTTQPAGTTSGADGSYSFSDIPLGVANVPIEDALSVSGPAQNPPDAPLGFWAAGATPTVTAGSTASADVALVPVCGGGSITATVYSQDSGLPLANATVFDGHASEVTDANGAAIFSHLVQGYNNGPVAYAFSASNEAGTAQSQGLVQTTLAACGDSSSVSLYLHQPVSNFGNVAGTVIDSLTSAPVPNATVSDNCGSASGGTFTEPGTLGQFNVDNVLIGTDATTSISCDFFANAPGYYSSAPVPVTIDAGLTSSATITMVAEESATVTGVLTDALTGQPVSGVSVSGPGFAVTDAQGRYTVSGNALLGLDNASQTVAFSFTPAGTLFAPATGTVGVAAGHISTLDIKLAGACGPATVSGTVYNASNQSPIAGALVASAGGSQLTNADGSFVLQIATRSVPFASSLTASAAGFNPKTETIDIFCGAHIVLNFGQNSSITGTLTGTVTSAATSAPVVGAFVGTGWGAATTTDAQGVFTLGGVPLGNNNAAETWDVTVVPPSGSALQPTIASVTVPGGVTTTLDIALGSLPPPVPVARNQSYTTPQATTLTVGAPGVLAGDTGAAISVTGYEATTAHFAEVTVQPDGSFTFIPARTFEGTDTFTYTLTDEYGVQAQATVSVQVGPEPVPPTDVAYTATATAGTALTVSAAQGLASQATGTGLTFAAASPPGHGVVTVAPDGSYRYTPDAGYTGVDEFFYTLTDAAGETVTDPVVVTVLAPAAPTAADYQSSLPEGSALTVTSAAGLLSGDTGVGISVTAHSAPSHGTLVVAADGGYTFTPTASYAGSDSFTYTVTDVIGRTATGTVSLTITPPPPSAPTYLETTPYKTPLVVHTSSGVLSRATGVGLTASVASAAADGSVSVQPDGAFTYTPYATFSGTDSFTYTVTDQFKQRATGTVEVVVAPQATTPPVAADYAPSTPADTPLVVSADAGLLSGDSGDAISVSSHSAPSHGTLVVNADGSYRYTPAASFTGADAFTYTITDSESRTASATVTISVLAPGAPTAPDYSEATPFATPFVLGAPGVLVLATGTGLHAAAGAGPSHGRAVVGADGSVTYTPDAGYAGPDSFTYTVTDELGRLATGTISITVTPPVGPTAPGYTATTPFDTALTADPADGVLSAASGTGLSLTGSTAPHHGTAVVNPDGSYTYTPDARYSGPDSFTYTVTDQFARSATGTVALSVDPAVPPGAADYQASTASGTVLSVDASHGLASEDTGTELTFALTSPPTHGTAVVSADGSYTYTPDAGFSGADSFTYTATDVHQLQAVGLVTLEVGTPAPPVVTSVTPSAGPAAGGTAIDVVGMGFAGATEVDLGGLAFFPAGSTGAAVAARTGHASSPTFTLESDTLITLVTAPGAGTVDIRVVTSAGTSSLSPADRFAYAAATAPSGAPPAPPGGGAPPAGIVAPVPSPVATAAAPVAATAPPPGVPAAAVAGGGPSALAFTGANLAALFGLALATLGAGVVLLRISRRARRGRHAARET